MCGIAGFFYLQNRNSIESNLVTLKNMASVISHRGKDDEGYYVDEYGIALAHKRLSIIDLSRLGHQPMYSFDKRYIIVYNGEVYNYRDIAKELTSLGVVFKSNSDTEVLLEAYKYYGDSFVELLHGMFAFVIWDRHDHTIFAARDRIGIKPFYYYFKGNTFVFASEIKSILSHPDVLKVPNDEAINSYLKFSHQLDNQTWFKDVYQLEPGNFLRITNEKFEKKTYWRPVVDIDYNRSFESFRDELEFRIIDSISSHQISDLPIGAHLSGGVDSSAIVSIASSLRNQRLHTFSSSFSNLGKIYDENREIDEVRNRFKTIHHKVSADSVNIEFILPNLINMLDEPVAGPAIIPMYFVNKLINESGFKVVNGGQGVDELFAGYPPFFTMAAMNNLNLYRNGKFVPTSELLNIPCYLYRGGSFKRFFQSRSRNNISLLKNPKEESNLLDKYYNIHNDLGQDISNFEKGILMSFSHYLPALLQQEDRMSMNWGIESRVPFLDHRLVELSLRIPSYFKVRNGVTKSIFRESLRGKVPDLILDNKVKRGYPTPLNVWSKTAMRFFIEDTLKKDKSSSSNEFLNSHNIENILNVHYNNRADMTIQIWAALCTKLWFKNHF